MALMDKINIIDQKIKEMKTSVGLEENVSLDELVAKVESGGGGTPVKSNIYRVTTIEERDAITDMVEGDMCVVNRAIIENSKVDSVLRTVIFPDTVVLPTAVSVFGTRTINYTAGTVSLSRTGLNVNFTTNNGSINIQYTTSDRKTFTRKDTIVNPVDLGTDVICTGTDKWIDSIGYFIQINSLALDGIFEYKNGAWVYAKLDIPTTSEYIYTGKKVYTDSGITIGTITDNPSSEFNDVDSEIYAKLIAKYSNMNVVVAPEDATEYFRNSTLRTIPIKTDGTPLLDTSNTTNMNNMFGVCKSLITIPLLNTSNVTNMNNMFGNCNSLISIPQLNTSNVTDMEMMFAYCKSLITIPLLDTSNVTIMNHMFWSCYNLTSVPQLDTSNATVMDRMFIDCRSLPSIPQLNTSNVTNMDYMFSGCTVLTDAPQLDTSNVTSMKGMFGSCTSLSDESLNNILAMAKNSKVDSSNKTTTYLGLSTAQKEKIKTLSNYNAFISAGWTNS